MKYLFVLFIILLTSCSIHKKPSKVYQKSLKDDINSSIIDGFFGGDTTKIPKNTYFL